MSVTIRMARHGRRKKPFYRVVVTDKENPRDGRYLELIGRVDPLTDPATVTLDEERVKYWIGVGAKPSETVGHYIEKVIPGYLKGINESRKEKTRAQRAKRKARASA